MAPVLPFVSVVMPIYNEEDYIEQSLGAVLAQGYPSEKIEILVIDGNSTDWTRDLVSQMAGRHGRIKLLDNPCRDQASALNIGIAEARGDVIIRVDGHGRIPPGYVARCVEVLQETGADNVGGRMIAVGTTPLTEAIALATSSPFGTGGARFHHSNQAGDVDTVYLGAFRREVFDIVGRFDPSAVPNEDYEFNYRLRVSGGRVYFTPEIWAQYYVRSSITALAKQYFRYGRRKAFVIRRHPASVRPRQLAAPLFVGALLVGFIGALLHPMLTWGPIALLVFYFVAVLVASVTIAAQHHWRLLACLCLVFPILHLTWGSGFWIGMIAQLLGHKD